MLELQPALAHVLDRHNPSSSPPQSRRRAPTVSQTRLPSFLDTASSLRTRPDSESYSTSSVSSSTKAKLPPMAIIDPPTTRLRVCIIGAGLGGLTLAQLLMSSPSVKVTCYERSATLDDRLTGYRVMLSGSTLTTLKGKLWNEVWSHIALSIGEQPEGGQRLEFFKGSGESIFNWDSEGMRDQFSVSRWQLRNGLLHRSEPFLKTGKMFVRYEELARGGVKVYFSDGTTDECDLLVGADGWNSRVKRQLLPYATVKHTDMCVVYFKLPLTPKTLQALNHSSGAQMAFCPHSMNIILGAWQNPLAPFATRYTANTIEPAESYIMFGLSSPVSAFHNRRTTPDRLTAAELKIEIISRCSNAPTINPRYAELARMACTNTAYIHMVRKVEAIKPWATQNVTLLGDSVFNMSNMLGKGANCALLDAVSLAETLTSPNYNRRSPVRLHKYVTENIDRRMRERHRSALMQKLVFYGENKLKGFMRDKALPYTLKRIDGLDREVHSKMANVPIMDWAREEESWADRSAVWAEELRWDEIYEEEHGVGLQRQTSNCQTITSEVKSEAPTNTSDPCKHCGSCAGSVAAPESVASDNRYAKVQRSGSINTAASSVYSVASTMSPSYPAEEAHKVQLGHGHVNQLHMHRAGAMAPILRGGVDLRSGTVIGGGDRNRDVISRASGTTTLVGSLDIHTEQDRREELLRKRQSMSPITRSVTSDSSNTHTSSGTSVCSAVCTAHGLGGCPDSMTTTIEVPLCKKTGNILVTDEIVEKIDMLKLNSHDDHDLGESLRGW